VPVKEGCGLVLGGAQDEIENLLGVLGHVFLLNKN